MLVAAERWSERPRLLPRGPWREPLRALHRAGVVAVTRKTAAEAEAVEVAGRLAALAPGAVQVRLAILPASWRRWRTAEQVSGTQPVPPAVSREHAGVDDREAPGPGGVLVCGVADPELFLANAAQAGARPAATLVFPDHHLFEAGDLATIRRMAAQDGFVLTTEKDAVKLSTTAPDLELWVLEQEVRLEAGRTELDALIDEVLQRRSPSR